MKKNKKYRRSTKVLFLDHRNTVNFIDNERDFKCALLAGLGFSDQCITKETKFTKGQIAYRLKKAAIQRKTYRNGKSTAAQKVMGFSKTLIEGQLKKDLQLIA